MPGDRKKQKARSHLLQRLSIILCNGNARQIIGCRSSMEVLPTPSIHPPTPPTLSTLAHDDSDDELPEPDITQF